MNYIEIKRKEPTSWERGKPKTIDEILFQMMKRDVDNNYLICIPYDYEICLK